MASKRELSCEQSRLAADVRCELGSGSTLLFFLLRLKFGLLSFLSFSSPPSVKLIGYLLEPYPFFLCE